MLAGLLCRSTLRHLRVVPRCRVVLGVRWEHPLAGGFWVPATGTERIRALHVKVSDKEARLEAQREVNEHRVQARQSRQFEVAEAPEPADPKEAEPRSQEIPKEALQTRITEGNSSWMASTDSDTFGDGKHHEDYAEDSAEEVPRSRHINRHTKKKLTREYAALIKEHLNAHRLNEALEVLEKKMLKEDGAKPENYIYNLLISGCAKAGYTRKAFSLYTKMRQRGLKATGGTYTSLFNACANAPSAGDGLQRANQLREAMLEKDYAPNVLNYNAMIKAYGRCGDVKTAYTLADEMLERKLEVNTETFNFLLQACASDKEWGFRHCLLTWHKMRQRGIRPDYYSFNAALRCTRDCSFGDLQTMHGVLQQILSEGDGREVTLTAVGGTEAPQKVIESGTITSTTEKITPTPTVEAQKNPFKASEVAATPEAPKELALDIPNLLAARPHLGSLVSLAEVTKPHERFLLLGGLTGFLAEMKAHQITPDIETFTTILEVIPPTKAAEKQVIAFIRKIGLKVDIDFFNILIKKRSMRFDYEGAKEVLAMISTAGLRPDIVTYGVLALGCQTVEEARELLQQMRNADIRMNIQILGAMLRQGCAHRAFPYITEILQISLDEHVKPNEVFLRHLHKFHTQCARTIDARHPLTKTKAYKKGHAQFCDKLRLYYEEEGLANLKLEDAIKKVKERPYAQYKEARVDGLEPLKNEKKARQQKYRKHIKRIKLRHLQDDEVAVEGGDAAPPRQRIE